MEMVGIIIALLAAAGVFFHAWIRQTPIVIAALWAVGVFFFLIIVLPIYILVRPKGGDPDEDDEGFARQDR